MNLVEKRILSSNINNMGISIKSSSRLRFRGIFIRLIVLLLFGSIQLLWADSAQIFHKPIQYHPPYQTIDLEIIVERTSKPVDQVTVHYREVGNRQYIESKMRYDYGVYRGYISAENVTKNGIEYFFIVHLSGGGIVGYPSGDAPHLEPIVISTSLAGVGGEFDTSGEGKILIISPNEAATVLSNEMLIAVSLFNVQSVDLSSVKVFIDGKNYTNEATILEELISIQPTGLFDGRHTVEIEMRDMDGNLFPQTKWTFFSVGSEKDLQRNVAWRANLTAKSQSEYLETNFGVLDNTINKLNFSNSFDFGGVQFRSRLYLTDEEDEKKQPRHRGLISADIMDILSFRFLDTYPLLTQLTMSGSRIRGFEGKVHLGGWNVHLVRGQLLRKVQPNQTYTEYAFRDTISVGNDVSELDQKPNEEYGDNIIEFRPGWLYHYREDSSKYVLEQSPGDTTWIIETFRKTTGIWDRNVGAVRVSVGKRHFFQWGISTIHSRDDIYSLDLETKEDSLSTNAPRDNLLLGTDLFFAVDNQRAMLEFESVISLENRDISSGSYSIAQLDTLVDDELDEKINGNIPLILNPQDIEKLFILNSFLVPTPAAFLSTSTCFTSVATTARLSLNYLKNLLKIRGKWIGPEYVSHSNQYVQKDIMGVEVSDRMRLFSDRLYVYLRGEYFQDNLANSHDATTQTYAAEASMALYLGRRQIFGKFITLPNLNLKVRDNRRSNGLSSETIYAYSDTAGVVTLSDTVDYRIGESTQTFTASVAYSIPIAKTIHQLNLSAVSSLRDDNFSRPIYENESTFFSSSVRSQWSGDVKTNFAYSTNSNRSAYSEFRFDIINGSMDITAYHRQIHILAGVKYFSSKGETEFNRISSNFIIDWRFLPRHVITLRFDQGWRRDLDSEQVNIEKQVLLQYNFSISK